MASNYFPIFIRKSTLRITFAEVKRFAAIAFIFLLSAQCIFKLTIITYFQTNRDYIAEVLCVNKEKPMTLCMGQCFLDRNLSLGEDESPKQAPATAKISIETTLFIANNFLFSPLKNGTDIETSTPPQSLYRLYSQRTLFHPPC